MEQLAGRRQPTAPHDAEALPQRAAQPQRNGIALPDHFREEEHDRLRPPSDRRAGSRGGRSGPVRERCRASLCLACATADGRAPNP